MSLEKQTSKDEKIADLCQKMWNDEQEDILKAAKELQPLYKTIEDKITKGKTEANAKGKKLLILIGEKHGDNTSFMVEALAMKAAKDLNIDTLALEMCKNFVQEWALGVADIPYFGANLGFKIYGTDSESERCGAALGQLMSKSRFRRFIAKLGCLCLKFLRLFKNLNESQNWYLLKNDPKTQSENRTKVVSERDKKINENLYSLDTDLVSVYGQLHLESIMKDEKLRKRYHIVAIATPYEEYTDNEIAEWPQHYQVSCKYVNSSAEILKIKPQKYLEKCDITMLYGVLKNLSKENGEKVYTLEEQKALSQAAYQHLNIMDIVTSEREDLCKKEIKKFAELIQDVPATKEQTSPQAETLPSSPIVLGSVKVQGVQQTSL